MRKVVALALLVACDSSVNHLPDAPPVAEPDAAAPACVAPAGPGTQHASVVAPETWTAADSPHVIPADLKITAALTIEPCAVVRVGAAKSIAVRSGGSITAVGAAGQPVTFERLDPALPWASIVTIGGTLSFTHARLVGGGDRLTTVIDVAGVLNVSSTVGPAPILHADHLEIRGSASQGIVLTQDALFSPASTALVITGSAHAPLHAWANAAGSIPDGSYTGNAIDRIVLEGGGAGSILRDTTFHDRGVPYTIGDALHEGRLDVATPAGGLATLTIEPGVQLRFKKDGSMFVQFAQNTSPATGALVAVGTAAKPIVFTSDAAAPAAGDWQGIHFNGLVDPRTELDFVRVEFAGGSRQNVGSSCSYENPPVINDAAIRVFVEPPASFISHTTVVATKRHGFDRGWLGTSNVSFLTNGNVVQGFAACKESFPHPPGACPTPVPCPQ